MGTTTFTINIEYSIEELKKAYAFFHGVDTWRSVNKSMIAVWFQSLIQSDVDEDISTALKKYR